MCYANAYQLEIAKNEKLLHVLCTPYHSVFGKYSLKSDENSNIIFFLVDDLGWNDLGCLDS